MLKRRLNRAVRRLRRARRLREIRAGKTILKSLPATVNMEFSGRCNVWPPCTYCVGKHAPGYEEPPPISEKQLKPYWKYLLGADRVNDTTYGEPLMYPGIHQLIDRMGEAGVKFGFTSNGLLLTEKKARLLAKHGEHVHMCISLNAASKETYYLHQGKDFDKLLVNIERFIAIHRETRPESAPQLILSFIVMRSNRHEVMDFVRLARRLGAPQILFRHLFDLGRDDFEADVFGQHFEYGRERLAFDEYKEIERQVRESEELKDGTVNAQFAWNGNDSFIRQQSEPGVDIPCLFPWKFLCIRPLHGFYTPCVYIKKGIAKTNETVDEVWNGEVMQGLRRELAAGNVPKYCCEHSDMCPLVLEKREREKAEHGPDVPVVEAGERRVRLPVLAGR
jgi:MoaA/NifB/PqqE/SkfB family radical SAM enzyme